MAEAKQRVSDDQIADMCYVAGSQSYHGFPLSVESMLALDLRDLRATVAELEKKAADWTDRAYLALDQRDKAEARVRELREALEEYGEHANACPLARYEAGRPTEGGGYEMKFAGDWYEVKPEDKRPTCTCGFSAALANTREVGLRTNLNEVEGA